MITIHHLNQSRSKRVLWLLEELEMPYEKIDHQRDAKTHLAPDSLKAIHPLGKAPVMIDGDLALCESSTIMEYILDESVKLGIEKGLRPSAGSLEYYQYLEWSHFAEGSLGLPVITHLFMTMESREGVQPMDGYIAKEVSVDFSHIENTLASRDYFAGATFTAADIMMTIILEIAANAGLLEGKKITLEYLNKMQQRPAYKKAASFG